MIIPGYKVTILVNGVALPEYNTAKLTPDPPGVTVPSTSCYIKSIPDAEFGIALQRVQGVPPIDIVAYYELDGIQMAQRHFRKVTRKCETIRGKESRGLVAPFKFDKVQLGDSDDEGLTTDEMVIKNLGTIKVLFHAAVLGESKPRTHSSLLRKLKEPMITSQAGAKVHEKSKKGLLSNVTALGEPRVATLNAHTVSIKHVSPLPFFEVMFHYRSAPLLEALGIVVIPIPGNAHLQVPAPGPAIVPPPNYANALAELDADAAIIKAEIDKGVKGKVKEKGTGKVKVEKGNGKGKGKRLKQEITISSDEEEYAVVGKKVVKRVKIEKGKGAGARNGAE